MPEEEQEEEEEVGEAKKFFPFHRALLHELNLDM